MADPDLATPEPDNEIGSLNHVDFGQPKVSWAVRKALSMLPEGKRRLFFLASAVQVALGLLDLVGLALIGVVAAVAAAGIGAATDGGGLSLPKPVTNVLDAIGLGGLTVSQLSVLIAVAAVLVLVAKTALSALMTRRITRFLANRQAELSVSLARRFLRRPLAEVQRWTTTEAMYALGNGVNAATVGLLGSTVTIVSEFFLFGIIGVSLLLYDPVVTITAGIFFGVIVFFLQRVLGGWSARNAEIMKTTSVDTLSAVSEAISTYREATVLNRRDLYIDKYSGVVTKYAGASANNAFIAEVPKYVLETALYVGVLLLAIVQFLTQNWTGAAATTALFLAAGTRVMPSLLRLQGAAITIRNSAVMAQPTFYMYDLLEAADPNDASGQKPRVQAADIHRHIEAGYPGFTADVVVDDITVTFSDASVPTLSGISLKVPQGSSMAFVGSTGAGKSTLADVILGVQEAELGTVTIGGVAPREAIDRWPGAISYVPQLVALVPGTVRQNVAFGLPDDAIDDDLVWEALHRAHLSGFLSDERDGLATYIGERGFKLSGGQRQRLGIARALYTRPRLLVLDEATSALDAETEMAIIETLQELEGHVTTITVAHRLATVRHADQLIYLVRGRIAAQGNFDEVRAQSPDFDSQARLLGM